jgi:predicted  nucleic acid-binding Zn-ribbon protein
MPATRKHRRTRGGAKKTESQKLDRLKSTYENYLYLFNQYKKERTRMERVYDTHREAFEKHEKNYKEAKKDYLKVAKATDKAENLYRKAEQKLNEAMRDNYNKKQTIT